MVTIVLCFLCLLAIDISKAGPSLGDEDAMCKREVLPSITKEFVQSMDKSVKPCDNFYQHVCGKSNINVKTVLEKPIDTFSRKFLQQKVDSNSDLKDLKNKARLHYQSCMDMDTRRKRGVEPLLEYTKTLTGFDVIRQEFVSENFDWLKAEALAAKRDSYFFLLTHYERGKITIYKDHSLTPFNKSMIEKIFIETGVNTTLTREAAEEIEKLEIHLDSVKEDPDTPHRIELTFQELKSKIPDIDWEKYFEVAEGHLPWQKIILYSPSYFKSLGRKLDQASSKTIANFIFLKATVSSSLILDGRYNEIFENLANPHGKKQDPDPERWCRHTANFWLGDVVTLEFLREHNTVINITEAIELVKFLKNTAVKRQWSNAKEEFAKDLAKIDFDFQYPDYFRSDKTIQENYKDLEIIPGKYFESQHNAMRYYRLMKHKKLNITYSEWIRSTLSVSVVNDGNNIQIPVEQLQLPYYHYCFPKAINFGAVGTVIANAIVRKIGESPHCSTGEWFGCVPNAESVHIAYKAYTDWIKETSPKKNLVLPKHKDISDKQLFFIAYAHRWCGSNRPEVGQLIRDALSNLTEFTEVFGCPAGSNMIPEKKYNSAMHNSLT